MLGNFLYVIVVVELLVLVLEWIIMGFYLDLFLVLE